MKKIIFILLVITGFTVSCTKNFEDFNTDKKHAVAVPGDFLFANAEKALGDQIASSSVNLNVFKLWAQYWTETQYTEEANYDLLTRTIPDNTYLVLYRDVISDLREARRVIEAEAPIGDEAIAAQQNRLQIITLVEAYAFNYLLETFGDIPYTEALNIDDPQPKYDDAATVYADLLGKVKEATDALTDVGGSFGSNDLIFAGDIPSWRKFGNSLRIKMAITLADVDNATAQSNIEEAAPGAFGPGESASMVYPGGTVSNPIYLDLVASGRHDFVPANTIIDMMNSLEDPRRDDYFTFSASGDVYEGGIYGESNPFDQLSHISDPIQDPTYPVVFIDYTEIAFYLAESAERGYNVGGTAEEWYNEGVTSSILSWGGTEAEAADYLANPDVAYATAEGDWKQKIGTQAWLAYYVRGLEGYTSWRRLDFPILNLPPSISNYNEIPKRFTYPSVEQTLNQVNWEEASAAIGGDEMTTKLFWDIF